MLDATVTVFSSWPRWWPSAWAGARTRFAVQALVGAVLGALIAVVATDAVRSMEDYLARMDASLACLEAGLPL